MFSDNGWVDDGSQSRIYVSWKNAVFKLLKENSDLKIAIVEIGCGIRVTPIKGKC
jgi:hypothetical protein